MYGRNENLEVKVKTRMDSFVNKHRRDGQADRSDLSIFILCKYVGVTVINRLKD